MIEFDKIYNLDCLEGMKQIPDGSIDLIVTDPPYKITSRGNAGNSGGMMQKKLSMKGRIFNHNDIEIEDYIHEFYRVLKDGTHCYIMCNQINLVHFLKVIDDSNFHFVKSLIWDKVSPLMGRYYMSRFEYILFLRKGRDRSINECGTADILTFLNSKPKDKNGDNLHDSAKPVPLFQVLIKNSCEKGDVVLDPFIGSGTTAIACIKEKRHFIGFEIEREYCKIAQKRVDAEKAQLSLF